MVCTALDNQADTTKKPINKLCENVKSIEVPNIYDKNVVFMVN